MNENKLPKREIIILALGEVVVGLVITAIYLFIGKFNYTVPLGSLLGGAVTVFNFVFLSISVNRAIDEAMKNYEARQNSPAPVIVEESENAEALTSEADENEESSEPDPFDDEAAKFARENADKIANAAKLSYIVRTASVVITLVIAFITKQFNVIATVIPLLCFRPILTLTELIKRKKGGA